jgi:cobalt-zinc-cadmium efflux system membrane fusion protein
LSIVLFSCKETEPEEVVIRDDTMVTVTAPQFKSSTMEIASPTEQDFEVTIKAAGKLMFRQKQSKSNYFRWW